MSMLIPILLYHSISENSSPQFQKWVMHPETFEAHMHFLCEQHYTPLTVTQLANALDSGEIYSIQWPIVITFDDGFADFYMNALPILTKYNLSATIYIATGFIENTSSWLSGVGEGKRRMMTWGQVAEIDALGIECGSHTQTHPQLDILPVEVARKEIAVSKTELEQHLGHEVSSFAYPHGYYNRVVRDMVKCAEYSSACAVKHAMSRLDDDRFALGRIIVAGDTTVGELMSMLSGQGISVAQTQERYRTTVWRIVRRTIALVNKQRS